MARKPRIEFPGAFYHVISRGNQRQNIFHDKSDNQAYLNRLEHYRKKYQVTVYAFVLMSNHIHLLVETQDTPLSKFMQGLQFTYTQYYNRKYSKAGHLFQGRYKAILCDRDTYLLELVRYLHLNPSRMKRRVDPWKYPWSSHRAYIGDDCPVGIEKSLVLGQFGRTKGQARRSYLRFMREGMGMEHEERYYETIDQRFLGDERFIEGVDRRTEGKREVEKRVKKVPFSELVAVVAKEYRVDPDALLRGGRNRSLLGARSMLVYLVREWSGISCKELARRISRDPSVISRLYSRYAASRDVRTESKIIRILKR
jgi:REP element-mobilizing transposase RayT